MIPVCFSSFDRKDKTCNGDRNSTDSKEILHCALRPSCRAFTYWIKTQKIDVEMFLSFDGDQATPVKGEVDFMAFCQRLIANSRKRKNEPWKLRWKGHKKKSVSAELRKKLTIMGKTLKVFLKIISDGLLYNSLAVEGTIAHSGQLQVIKSLSKKGAISIICKNEEGKDQPVCKLYVIPTRTEFVALLPLSVKEAKSCASASTLKIEKNTSTKRFASKHPTAIRGLDKFKMALLADILVSAINKGIMELPRCH